MNSCHCIQNIGQSKYAKHSNYILTTYDAGMPETYDGQLNSKKFGKKDRKEGKRYLLLFAYTDDGVIQNADKNFLNSLTIIDMVTWKPIDNQRVVVVTPEQHKTRYSKKEGPIVRMNPSWVADPGVAAESGVAGVAAESGVAAKVVRKAEDPISNFPSTDKDVGAGTKERPMSSKKQHQDNNAEPLDMAYNGDQKDYNGTVLSCDDNEDDNYNDDQGDENNMKCSGEKKKKSIRKKRKCSDDEDYKCSVDNSRYTNKVLRRNPSRGAEICKVRIGTKVRKVSFWHFLVNNGHKKEQVLQDMLDVVTKAMHQWLENRRNCWVH